MRPRSSVQSSSKSVRWSQNLTLIVRAIFRDSWSCINNEDCVDCRRRHGTRSSWRDGYTDRREMSSWRRATPHTALAVELHLRQFCNESTKSRTATRPALAPSYKAHTTTPHKAQRSTPTHLAKPKPQMTTLHEWVHKYLKFWNFDFKLVHLISEGLIYRMRWLNWAL